MIINRKNRLQREWKPLKPGREIIVLGVTETIYVFLSHSLHFIIVDPSTLKVFSFGTSKHSKIWLAENWERGKPGSGELKNKTKQKKTDLELLYSLDIFTWLIYGKMQGRGRAVTPSLGLTTINELWPRETRAVSQQTDFHCSLEVRKGCCLEKYQLYPRNCQLLLSILPLKIWPIAQKSTGWPWSQWLVVVKQYL